jgi:hypothetical protein
VAGASRESDVDSSKNEKLKWLIKEPLYYTNNMLSYACKSASHFIFYFISYYTA